MLRGAVRPVSRHRMCQRQHFGDTGGSQGWCYCAVTAAAVVPTHCCAPFPHCPPILRPAPLPLISALLEIADASHCHCCLLVRCLSLLNRPRAPARALERLLPSLPCPNFSSPAPSHVPRAAPAASQCTRPIPSCTPPHPGLPSPVPSPYLGAVLRPGTCGTAHEHKSKSLALGK